MTNEVAFEYMWNEIECVKRASNGICTRDCNECDLVREDKPLLEAYKRAIVALKKQIPEKICGDRTHRIYFGDTVSGLCPNCWSEYTCITPEYYRENGYGYCQECGQKIDLVESHYNNEIIYTEEGKIKNEQLLGTKIHRKEIR